MKKFWALILASVMILSCMVVFSSCTPRPKMNLEDAADNLEDEDYDVYYCEDADDMSYEDYLKFATCFRTDSIGCKEAIYASNGDDYLIVIVFSDSKLAKLYYEEAKASMNNEKENLEREIERLEHMLKKYDDDFSSYEIDSMEDELKELKKELKEYKEYVIGKSGKTVWAGTKDAIKDSKG